MDRLSPCTYQIFCVGKFLLCNGSDCFSGEIICRVEKSAVECIYDIGYFPDCAGIGIYNTIYDFMTGDVEAGILSGLGTFKAVAAIVLGIVCVFVIPDKWFRSLKFYKKESKR